MTWALRQAPLVPTNNRPITLKAYAYWGCQSRGEIRFPGELSISSRKMPISGVLIDPLPAQMQLKIYCRAEVTDLGLTPDFPAGAVWGTRLKRPITALKLWLEGERAEEFELNWYCGFKFLGYGDLAIAGEWRSGLHQKDALMSLYMQVAARA